jgi:hypothetical protein
VNGGKADIGANVKKHQAGSVFPQRLFENKVETREGTAVVVIFNDRITAPI